MLLERHTARRRLASRAVPSPADADRAQTYRAGAFDFRWIDSDDASLLAAHGLDDLEDLLQRAQRDVEHFDERDDGPQVIAIEGLGRAYRLKCERPARFNDLLLNLLSGRGLATRLRREFELLHALRAAGIRCPRPVAFLQRGLVRPVACLLIEEPADARPLNVLLADQSFDDAAARRDFFTRLGRDVARLHAEGVCQGELFATHVLVQTTGMGCEFAFREFGRATHRPPLSLSARAADLAALWATLPARSLQRDDERHFFDAYLAENGLQHRSATLLAAVTQRVDRLLTQRRIWEIRESDTEQHRSIQQLQPIESGQMWIDSGYRPHLVHRGLDHFDAVMATTKGHRLRALRDRENWRLELHDGRQPPRGAYLKKHHVRDWRTWLRAKLGLGPGETAGRVEARNIVRLARGGIAAMRLIAFGEKLHRDGLLESFVLTDELAGYTQLDHFLRQRFPARVIDRPTERDKRLHQLIRDVAGVARHFHALGYNHRDLYCCHFFIHEKQPGQFQVNLIDLQRVEHRRRWRRRWIVKDLAQLAYSAPRDRISCTQRMAFMRAYLGVDKLRPQDKRLIRRVLWKQRWMERTLGLHP